MKCPRVGRRNMWNLPAVGRQGIKWRDGVAIPKSNTLTQNCTSLKELQRQKWRRDWGKDPVTSPDWDPSQGGGSKVWHYYWCCDVLTDRSLAWLPSEWSNKQLTETEADTYTQPMDRSWGLCGWIKERLEEEGDPIGRPAVSNNSDPWDLSDTEPPTRQHTPADMNGLPLPPSPNTYTAEDCLVWPQWEKMHLTLERLGASGNGEVWQGVGVRVWVWRCLLGDRGGRMGWGTVGGQNGRVIKTGL